jgi:peptidoglycan/xylan/chitin deacetylase (PgdA/CDA1 family)
MRKIAVVLSIAVFLIAGFWVYLNFNYEVPILMYHSIDESRVGTYAAVSPQRFYEQMNFLDSRGYRVMSLIDYCRALKRQTPVPRNAVVITFDDGYKDNLKAIEVLREFAYPATIFIIGNKIGEPGYLSKTDINSFLDHSLVTIGSHTLNEVYLPDVDLETARYEISRTKIYLEELFSRQVLTFAYSIGGFNREILREVENSGYECACATNRGFNREIDLYALRRIKITNRDVGVRFWGKVSGFYNIFKKPKNPF